MNFLRQKGIGTAIHYPQPVHLQPAYRTRILAPAGLAVTESIMDELVSLPMFPQLGAADVELVSLAVLEWCRLGA